MKALDMYAHGDEALFRLFDIAEMEHVCDLVRQLDDPTPKGARAGLSDSLRLLLLAPINHFMGRLHECGRGFNASEYPAVDEFRMTVENVAQLLAIREGRPMDRSVAGELASELESSWTKFIAHGAAFRMYDELPRDLAAHASRRKRNAESSKLGGEETRKAFARPGLDDLIRAAIEKGEPMYVEAWVEEFGIGRSSIYRRIARIKRV